MRDVNLQDFKVKKYATYFGHVAHTPLMDAAGLVLVYISDGSVPCLGIDSDPNDGYEGHVFRYAGKRRGGIEVQYMSDGQYIGDTMTDPYGHHSLRLPPGLYQYRFIAPGETEQHEIMVKPGRRIAWEEMDAAGNHVGTYERPIKFVQDALVCNWVETDQAVHWQDLQETIVKINTLVGAGGGQMRRWTCSQFAREDMLKNLRARGVSIGDNKWGDRQYATALRNLSSVIDNKLHGLLDHPELKAQLLRNINYTTNTKVEAPTNAHNHLALCLAGAVFNATATAGVISNGLQIYDPRMDGHRRPGSKLPAGFQGNGYQVLETRD